MSTSQRFFCDCLMLCLVFALAVASAAAAEEIVANQNRVAAGKLENGVLNVKLELRSGAWRAEAEDGPQLFVQAFGEVGHATEIPGPLLRMTEGTTVHATVTNKLKLKATLYGLNTRPGDENAGVEIRAGESHEFTFAAGAAGTYYYWARTTEPLKTPHFTIVQPLRADAHLNGAFIVDPAGPAVADRVLVINSMIAESDVIHPSFEVVTINGKSYPYTEPLDYTAGDRVRWRVINPSFSEHPMHLHGAFYEVLSYGNFEKDTSFAEGERQSVVTQDLHGGNTMMLEWTPQHAGRWLFHCHFHLHVSADERVPVFRRALPEQYSDPDEEVAAAGTPRRDGRDERHGGAGDGDQCESAAVDCGAECGRCGAENGSGDRAKWRGCQVSDV